MQFCDECGSLMHADGDEMVCSGCGVRVTKDEERASRFVSTQSQTFDDVIETEEGLADEGKPTAEVICDECGHDRAWYTIKQTASADEPPTRFSNVKSVVIDGADTVKTSRRHIHDTQQRMYR